jgi:hypothetical protein
MTMTSGSTRLVADRRAGFGTAATVGGSVLTAWSAIIHLHLWNDGYRHIATIGPLFLAQGVTGLVLAGATLIWRRPATAAAATAFLLATAAGLILSATVGLFGLHDQLDAPYAGLSLFVQGTGAALFATAAVVEARNHGRAPTPR